ncbi:hypothetical protein HAX54_048143 [Datura stramonium]|uniref:Uncharacterized protein n=1 Tax=Datura stramonium TaxID=4076 RepID=A0ABS8WKV3_DATST|nr:hypothetical protein [Datura stramonium]
MRRSPAIKIVVMKSLMRRKKIPTFTPEERSKRWFLQGSRDVYYAVLHLDEKGNPSRSIQEEPKIQTNALNEVLELKRIFEGYNMHWMTKTRGKYMPSRTIEYDYRMGAMNGIRKLSIEDKMLHFQWMTNITAE